VRFVGNRSSGRMGYAVAAEAPRAGAPRWCSSRAGLDRAAGGARESCVSAARPRCTRPYSRARGRMDIVIMAAAVANYTPREVAGQKIPHEAERVVVELTATPDILADLSAWA